MPLNLIDSWLIQSTIFGAIVLAVGGAALLLVQQPVHRIRVIQSTLLACLLVPALQQIDMVPSYCVTIWSNSPPPSVATATGPGLSATEGSAANASLLSSEALGRDPRPMQGEDTASSMVSFNPEIGGREQVSTVPSEERRSDESTHPLHAVGLLLRLAYLAGVVVLAAAWSLGFSLRWRIVRNSWPADARLQAPLRDMAGTEVSRIRLLVSDRVDSPIMWGIVKPTIVVPVRLADNPQSWSLKYGLAHEWSHIARGDVATVALANLAKFVCFYQPVYWWMRKQLALSQDYLADAFAAGHGECAEDYAAFLVSLAKRRKAMGLAGVLCMADRKSNLFCRVCMLVEQQVPLRQRAGRLSTLSTTAVAASLVLVLGSIRVGAQPADERGEAPATDKAAAHPPAEDLPDPITYTGKVVDRQSGAPIAGAVVMVTRELSRDPKTGQWITLETTEHETDDSGQYSFTLPPEQVAESSLYLVVDAVHADYQPKGRSGYAHSMILKNLDNGEPPFYETIKLSSGEPVTVKVIRPDGQLATDVRISAYTKAPGANSRMSFERGAFHSAITDEQGEARIVVPTPGDGVIWVYPKNFAPVAIRIGDRRGKLEDVVLHEGISLSGRVLNAHGEPVPNVAVNVRRRGDGEEADEFLNNNAVANGIRTGTTTDAEGRFELNPLPPGDYRAEVSSRPSDPTEESEERAEELQVKDVFLPLQITISDQATVEPIEIRAVPHVIVRGRFFDSNGKPRASHRQHLVAKANGQHMFFDSTLPGDDGWFEFKVPHGAEEAALSWSTNEHSSLRWRLAPGEPLQRGDRGLLGTLEEDFTTVEVVRYEAPILLLKAVDENGNQLRDFIPKSKYKSRPADESMGTFVSGGDIGFEEQADGRWRSSQMLPDEEVTISLEMEGYSCDPQTISMAEGETTELLFVMKKSDRNE